MTEPTSPARTIRFRQPLTASEGDRSANSAPSIMSIRTGDDLMTSPVDMDKMDKAVKGSPTISKRVSLRSAKALEEIKAEKVMTTEVWYEELECGICAHVLGASQALVPCGHSFCGPCAWQWIILDQNYTCPHCRTQISAETPLVPNIIVDQIVERKLQSLQKGTQKEDLLSEREDKVKAWRVLQNELHGKPKRRTKGFDEWFSRFSGTAPESNEVRRRRASRHIELGAPFESPPIAPERPQTPRTLSGGMTLAQLRRMELEEARAGSSADNTSASGTPRPASRGVPAIDRFALERGGPLRHGQVRAVESRDNGREWTSGRDTNAYAHVHGPGNIVGTTTTTTTITTSTTPRPVFRPQAERAYTSPAGRHGPLRSSALMARQARGHRSNSIVTADSGESETD